MAGLHKYSIVACARWERNYIVEWMQYHFLLGFDHIYIYSNDDTLDDLFSVLLPYLTGDNPRVTLRHYPYQGQQAYIYRHFLKHYRHETEWAMFLDIDEFINLNNKDFRSFMRSFDEDVFSIYFNWIYFGNSDFKQRESRSILNNYVKRSETIHPYTKNIFRTSYIDDSMLTNSALSGKHFWHGWYGFDIGNGRRVNVIGEDMSSYYDGFPESARAFLDEDGRQKNILETAIIHHYCLKSEEDFMIRMSRGTSGNFGGQSIWAEMYNSGQYKDTLKQLNAIEDNSLATFWSRNIGEYSEMEVVPVPRGVDISSRGIATQSSLSQWSRDKSSVVADASGALHGEPSGGYSFHTDLEENPWWLLDLNDKYKVLEIRIFNRVDDLSAAARARALEVEISTNGKNYSIIYQAEQNHIIGGVDGYPLRLLFEGGENIRFIRINLREKNVLHLDKVKIYAVTTPS
ncbi:MULTISPECIES: glycosyltransferase family 2 protein [Methylobacterium]|jgi:hypothetical protein|uniref:glycosyltransferase family 2 protein n=1 Tax=Methylobacterium TaxID=407 RepID=UPI0008E8A69F|nr:MULTISPECIES: glycosyltransferase family 2 protein [Methylobacterium]MBZ6415802.1 glycosyltransferase family 2 protein [Methylobacterium sp.]MBK3401011.1 glycosyltransferase family 2 protein [Methylobacterium ajmalii]MBK3408609.1 glycosyltransferase family 2 protein [Methylobacterium ajmalii]MBK3422494.1 glycosyltransferase family 2 protein [Methylobacterium ajmalii]SFF74618.1 F5/8 type C domain-containing protein [Methylobacterium sp. yr596]